MHNRYIVLEEFVDLQDDKHMYKEGDEYPRTGYSPLEERIKELLTGANILGKPLIAKGENKKAVEIKEEPKAVIEEKSEAVTEKEADIETKDNSKQRGKPKKNGTDKTL